MVVRANLKSKFYFYSTKHEAWLQLKTYNAQYVNSANNICVYALPICTLKHVCSLSALMRANLPTVEVYMNTEVVCVVFNKKWSISKAEQ